MSIDDQPIESRVDVLIIGAGPAGVMAADMLARYTAQGLTCRIIDKRSASLDNGELEALLWRRRVRGGRALMSY
jgi:phenol 2-monooxygenase (NADPH)